MLYMHSGFNHLIILLLSVIRLFPMILHYHSNFCEGMPPKKLQPQRKKQKTSEPSSSRAQNRELLSNREYAKERKKALLKKTFMNHQYLDWGLLQEYGMDQRLQELVVDKTWFKLFEINEPTFKDVAIKFLSTMQIERDKTSPTITFQALGEIHTIEIKQIGFFLGLYDDEDHAETLPSSWPDKMNAEIFWSQLIHPKCDDFVPSKSLASTFAAMEHKLLHHILAHTISCKKTSHSKVTSFDMFYLYSLISGYHIDLGVEVANFIARQVEDTRTHVILCGGYITALLKGMGILRHLDRDDGIPCKKISSAPFRSWGLFKIVDRVPLADTEETHAVSPTRRASTSYSAPPESTIEQVREEVQGIKNEVRKVKKAIHIERQKNKKFRTTLFNMFKTAISCINPSAAEELQYETSSEDSSRASDEDRCSPGRES